MYIPPQAIILAPHRALPHVAACISMGRLAVFSDNKTKVRQASIHALRADMQQLFRRMAKFHISSGTKAQQSYRTCRHCAAKGIPCQSEIPYV